MKMLTSLVLLLSMTLPAWSAQKIITRKQIDRAQGEVVLLMPCNWLRGSEKIYGLYGQELDRRALAQSKGVASGTSELKVVVAQEEIEGLAELWVEFVETRQRCTNRFGFESLSQ